MRKAHHLRDALVFTGLTKNCPATDYFYFFIFWSSSKRCGAGAARAPKSSPNFVVSVSTCTRETSGTNSRARARIFVGKISKFDAIFNAKTVDYSGPKNGDVFRPFHVRRTRKSARDAYRDSRSLRAVSRTADGAL